jgi:uncharacterized protein
MVMQNKVFKKYAHFVSNNPWTVLIIALIATVFMVYGLNNLKTVSMNYENILPKDNAVINSFNIISEEFGGENSITVVVEIDNSYVGSDEPLDIRDPRVINYLDKLTQELAYTKDVTSVSSISKIIKASNEEHIPNSLNEMTELLDKPALSYQVSSFISKDNSMSLISLKLSEDSDHHAEEIEREINLILDNSNKPAGISVSVTGDLLKDPQIMRIIEKDMSKTSIVSMIGIIFILLFMFRSLKDGFLPLTSIIFGVTWALGLLGLIGLGLNTMTSGTISMIMGIGIDFGIQIISRFKQEFKTLDKKAAMEKTMNAILGPICITTMAALIGFKAMSWGQLTMMAEMGNIMGLGVFFCMLAAITVVPSLILLVERDKPKHL